MLQKQKYNVERIENILYLIIYSYYTGVSGNMWCRLIGFVYFNSTRYNILLGIVPYPYNRMSRTSNVSFSMHKSRLERHP